MTESFRRAVMFFDRMTIRQTASGNKAFSILRLSINKNNTEVWLKPAGGRFSTASDTEHLGVSAISLEETLKHVKLENQPRN